MLAQPSFFPPLLAAFRDRTRAVLDVILHIGAHRTATTSFQRYVDAQVSVLAAHSWSFWGPDQTRGFLFSGLYDLASQQDQPGITPANVSQFLCQAEESGVSRLLISDENIIGSVRQNIREETLYPQVSQRVSQALAVLGGRVSQIVLSPRSLDTYWCSAVAYGVGRGVPVPSRAKLARIAASERTWRDVITDISEVAAGAKVLAAPFEVFRGRPDALLTRLGVTGPAPKTRAVVNAAPDLPDLRRVLRARGDDLASLPFGTGRWNPFANAEHAALRERYDDDIMWLTGGASGLATLTEDTPSERADHNLPQEENSKGQTDEFQERYVARPG